MAATTVNPDLARVRSQATFDPLQLTYFIYGGPEKTKRKRFLQNLAIKECKEQNFRRFAELSREEQYEEALYKSTYAFRRIAELGLKDPIDIHLFREVVMMSHCSRDHVSPYFITAATSVSTKDSVCIIAEINPLAIHYLAFGPTVRQLGTEEQKARVIFPSEPSQFGLHESMFIPTIQKQATEEQKEKWLPLAKRFGVVGTYAQTELGHGTFLRGLETTATYDPKTKEFVLNTPTVTSSKFWPGGLGKTANYCIVMAKLNTNGRDYGMQSFLVPIRDLDTHQPLPGVTVGDIGQKFGYGAMDNGFLRLDNVRIPRENMLMRYAQVLEDGTFVSPKNDRLVYGSMTLIRSQIVGNCGRSLAKAATIATRYSAVRKQSEINAGAGEVQVLDFQTQQYRLFTQIASAYALMIAGRASAAAYSRVSAEIESGNLDDMPVLHALSAGLKAFSSWEMMYGIEQCRLACGGHGYMLASGLPKIYANEVPACTYEGENIVLCLQTARFLIKCLTAAQSGQQLPGLAKFLQAAKGGKSRLSEKLELDDIVAAYEHRAARQIDEANARIQSEVKRGLKSAEAWNSSSQMLVEAAVAFTHAFIVRAFIEAMTTARVDQALKTVLIQLCQLYSLQGIVSHAGQFLKGGYLSDQQLALAEAKLYELLAALRPNAVALVDAFDFPDQVLDSDLGRYDGNVYEALMEYARRSKLNESEVHPGFYKYQKPFVESLKPQTAVQARL